MGNNPAITTVKGGIGFWKILKWGIGIILFGLIFVNCAIIIVQEQSVEAGFKYLGYTFFLTTEKLQDESLKVIERGAIYPTQGTFIGNLWEFIKNFGNLLSALAIIYGWLWVIAKGLLFFPIADNSKAFTAWFLAIFFFLLIQMIIIISFTDKTFWTPVLAFRDLGRAIYVAIQPVANTASKYDLTMENISERINNITIE